MSGTESGSRPRGSRSRFVPLGAALVLGACSATGTASDGAPTVTFVYDRTDEDLAEVRRDAEGYCRDQSYHGATLIRTRIQNAREADAVFKCI